MPYRRFPKTDTARLRSLGVLLDNNDVYAAKSRFISMDVITQAKKLHDQLKTLSSQFLLCYEAQMRNYKRVAKPQEVHDDVSAALCTCAAYGRGAW